MAGHEAGRSGLGRTRRRLERWRRQYGGPGRPIPDELWDEAVVIARVEGVDATARALRLDRGRLERRMASSGSALDAMGRTSDGFVEIDARGLCAAGQTVVRLEGRDGERLQIEWSSAGALDVAALIRAFGSRPR
jgi:hypothetical protein